MANFTKEAIKKTFLELLEKYPINEITVRMIVESCSINRKSFYYHFHDIPSLIEEIVNDATNEIIGLYPTFSSVEEWLCAITDIFLRYKKAVLHIFHSPKKDSYEQTMLSFCERFVRSYLDTQFKSKFLNEQTESVVVRLLKAECFGLLAEWISGGMSDDIKNFFKEVYRLRNGMTEELVRRALAENENSDDGDLSDPAFTAPRKP